MSTNVTTTETTATKATRTDVYERVTSKIVSQLEQGVRPWIKPWSAEHAAGRITRPLRFNGIPYSGINILMLWAESEEKGFACPLWLTFQQAKELGGHVKKGEHGSIVVYASTFKKTEASEQGDIEKDIPFFKQYVVFNAEQCEGLPDHYYATKEQPNTGIEPVAEAIRFVHATKAEIREGGNRAFYSITGNYIQMPRIETFIDAESHTATLAHELCHWTRHPSRLERDFGRKRFGDEGYAVEELVVRRGGAFVGV